MNAVATYRGYSISRHGKHFLAVSADDSEGGRIWGKRISDIASLIDRIWTALESGTVPRWLSSFLAGRDVNASLHRIVRSVVKTCGVVLAGAMLTIGAVKGASAISDDDHQIICVHKIMRLTHFLLNGQTEIAGTVTVEDRRYLVRFDPPAKRGGDFLVSHVERIDLE